MRAAIVIVVMMLVGLGSSTTAEAQVVAADSTFTAAPSTNAPRKALRRSAILPGWGQITNKQYKKLPFVYAAIGGLAYLAYRNNEDYQLYREAFQYKAWEEQVEAGLVESNPRSSFQGSYEQIVAEFGEVSSRPLETQRNNLRRSRDLSLIGVGLVYGLAMLDAYVSAHLLDFDVGEDLSFRAAPSSGGLRLSAQIRL